MRTFPLTLLTLLAPTAALAAGLGPPLTTPAQPAVPLGPVEIEAPPQGRPVAAPPLDLALPEPPGRPGFEPGPAQGGPPDPLPTPGAFDPPGPPDLTGLVGLPIQAADLVLGLAPPFGGPPPGAKRGVHALPVPEPASGGLLLLGLVALAARRR